LDLENKNAYRNIQLMKWVPVPTAWHIFGLKMEDSCEYTG